MDKSFIVRRAGIHDTPGILKLIADNSTDQREPLLSQLTKRYAHTDITRFIDLSPFSVVAVNTTDTRIIGFAAFDNCPIPAIVKPSVSAPDEKPANIVNGDWSAWLRERYDCKEIQLSNTKFLYFYFADPSLSSTVLQNILIATFTALPLLQSIAYLLPDSALPFPPLSTERVVHNKVKHKKRTSFQDRFFKEKTVLQQSEPYSLHVCSRDGISPNLTIRPAKVEDCDDLVPMFRKQKILDEEQGDFYLAQLLESKSDDSRTLVAESNQGVVVGFISLSTQINYTTLQRNFHLDPYDSLVYDSADSYLSAAQASVPESTQYSRKPQKSFESAWEPDGASGVTGNGIRKESERDPSHVDESIIEEDPEAEQEREEPVKDLGNAFTVTLFCIEDEFATQSGEFIKPAFQAFPDRDYCLLSLPTTTPDFQLLQSFVKVQSKSGKSPGHSLYLSNRYGTSSVLTVRRGLPNDMLGIKDMALPLPCANEILSRAMQAVGFKGSLGNDVRTINVENYANQQCYVTEAHDQIVGVALVDSAPMEDLEAGFDVEEFILPSLHRKTVEDGSSPPCWLRHLIINPIFAHQTRWFLEEILRQASATTLYYALDATSRRDESTRSRVIAEFVPVRRRRRIQFPNGLNDGTTVPPPRLHAMMMFTKNIIYEPKVTVNNRIVVIGGSDVGLSFIEKLVYRSHLYFTNITLISMEGIPTFEEGRYFVSQRCYTSEEIRQMGLQEYVRVTKSCSTDIDRDAKTCRLSNGSEVSYDYLVLAPGMQFYVADFFGTQFSGLENVYSVNRGNAAGLRNAMQYFAGSKRRDGTGKKEEADGSGKATETEKSWAVVWGRDIQAYAVIQGIIDAGGDPSRIAHILPPNEGDSRLPTCTENPVVNKMVQNAIAHLGITTFENYKLEKHDANRLTLKTITIVNKERKEVTLSVCAAFYAHRRTINSETFHSVNDSCLVFDGRLVADRYFHTQDPYIFAAGTVTKYSSKYRTRWLHEYVDSREVGAKVADKLLPKLDPLDIEEPEADSNELPRFQEAKKMECYLPGNYYYLHSDKPRLPGMTLKERQAQPDYGRDLVTQTDGGESESYFRIHLDPKGYIQSITYLGRPIIPTDNILSLYGLHESYLNRLVSRYDEGIIPDFVTFLNQTWAMPIYHDWFPKFLKESRREMIRDGGSATQNLVEELKGYLGSDVQIPDKERKALYEIFDRSEDRKLMERKVKDYLGYASFPKE